MLVDTLHGFEGEGGLRINWFWANVSGDRKVLNEGKLYEDVCRGLHCSPEAWNCALPGCMSSAEVPSNLS